MPYATSFLNVSDKNPLSLGKQNKVLMKNGVSYLVNIKINSENNF